MENENNITQIEEAVVQPAEEAAVQPAEETAVQPAEKAVVQPAEETAVQPAEEAVVQPAEETAAKPAKKKKKVRHMIWAVTLVSLLIVIFGGLAGSIPLELLQQRLNITDGGTAFLFMYLSTIGVVITLLLYLVICERPILRSFGYKAKNGGAGNNFKMFGLGLLAGFAMNGACILSAWLHGDIDFYIGKFDPVYMLLGILCVCVQSGSEEILTRGYMMRALDERYNIWVGIIYNSLFFGILHIFNPGISPLAIANIVLIGAALSLAAVYLKSIWFCIALHTAWNYCQSLVFGLPNSGIVSEKSFLHLEAAKDSALYDVKFGVESTWSAFAVELLVVVIFAALLIIKYKKGKKGETVTDLETYAYEQAKEEAK